MKVSVTIIIFLVSVSYNIYGQNTRLITSETSTFFCKEWLLEFPDTLIIYNNIDSIPENTKYSVIRKSKKNFYDLLCWTGEISMETPTESSDKLEIKFRNDFVIFKLGRIKYQYDYYFSNEFDALLIKQIE